jgi:hypothetical protein
LERREGKSELGLASNSREPEVMLKEVEVNTKDVRRNVEKGKQRAEETEENLNRREEVMARESEASETQDEVRAREVEAWKKEEAKYREEEARRKGWEAQVREAEKMMEKEAEMKPKEALEQERGEADFGMRQAVETEMPPQRTRRDFRREEGEHGHRVDDDFREKAAKETWAIVAAAEERRRQDIQVASGSFQYNPFGPWSAYPSGNGTSSSPPTDKRSVSSSSPTNGAWSQSNRTISQASNTRSASSSGINPERPSGSGPGLMRAEWARQQEQLARKKARKKQEELRRLEKRVRIITDDEGIRLLDAHERQWNEIATINDALLVWDSLPWPMLREPSEPNDLTPFAIESYVLWPFNDLTKLKMEHIKDHIRRWHPDRVETELLPKVVESQRVCVKQGAEMVMWALNGILAAASRRPITKLSAELDGTEYV